MNSPGVSMVRIKPGNVYVRDVVPGFANVIVADNAGYRLPRTTAVLHNVCVNGDAEQSDATLAYVSTNVNGREVRRSERVASPNYPNFRTRETLRKIHHQKRSRCIVRERMKGRA